MMENKGRFPREPVTNEKFAGRSDILQEIDRLVTPERGESQPMIRCATLVGLPGVGKSEIAREYLISRKIHSSSKKRFDPGFFLKSQKDGAMSNYDGAYEAMFRKLALTNSTTSSGGEGQTQKIGVKNFAKK